MPIGSLHARPRRILTRAAILTAVSLAASNCFPFQNRGSLPGLSERERVIHLLDRRLTRPETIVGLRAPLEGWQEAFDAMHDRRVIKSVLVPQAD